MYVATLCERMQEVSTGDEMIIMVRPERFSSGTVEIIHTKCTCPHMVLREIGLNPNELDIL